SLIGDNIRAFTGALKHNASFTGYLGGVLRAMRNSPDRFNLINEELNNFESGFASFNANAARIGEDHYARRGMAGRAGKIIEAGGLSWLTNANRSGVQDMLQGNIARHLDKTFVQLEKAAPDLAIKLREWGLERHWEAIRQVPAKEVPGLFSKRKTVDFAKLFDTNEDAGIALKRYVVGETRRTIITANTQGDRLLQLHTKGGTGIGETVRTMAQ